MLKRGEQIDYFTVTEALRRAGRYEGAASDLAGMARDSLSLNLEGDIAILRENLSKRRVLAAAEHIRIQIKGNEAPADEVAAKGIAELSNLLQPAEATLQDLESAARQIILDIESGKREPVIPTGLVDLDDALGGGLRRQTVTVVGGRTSMGKSALALQIARYAAAHGSRILYFSIEMPIKALARRVLSTEAGIEPLELRLCGSPDDAAAMRECLSRLGGPNLMVNDDPSLTSGKAVAVAHKLKIQRNLDVVFVDYLQRLNDLPASGENRTHLLGRISKTFAIMARRLNVVVVLMSQLSRKSDTSAGNEPKLSDLRDSGEIEQDADNVFLLHRPHYYDREKDEHEALLFVAKQREGPTCDIGLYWDSKRVVFRDREWRHVP